MLSFAAPNEICLRDYQADAVEALREGIRRGQRRLILCAGTGAGKTVCASHLLKQASARGGYALFMVDRVALVKQTSAVLDQYGIRHGVVQGNHPRWEPRENVQVCSIQTLAKRILPRDPTLFIYDEAHCQFRATLDFMARFPDAVKIGLTATPFTPGMSDHWDGIINVRSTRALIGDGHLIEPVIYVARAPEDSELGLTSFGEFSDDSASKAGMRIIGDVVQEWVDKTRQHFGGPVKTIVFSPTVEHGRELCAAFAAAGFNFQQISYLDRNEAERDEKISEFRRADSVIHGLVSCGVLTKGFDVPDVLCGISCKPYRKSLSSHIQEIGRVMRSHPDKTQALWLCHSGNVERFALDMFEVWEHGVDSLASGAKRDKKARVRDETTRVQMVCPECAGVLRGNICLACGWERPARSGIAHVPGEMRKFDLGRLALEARPGLRAECLADPRAVWNAALVYCVTAGRDEERARKQAFAVWKGIYPEEKLPGGWYRLPVPALCDQAALSLIDREVRRFRDSRRRAA